MGNIISLASFEYVASVDAANIVLSKTMVVDGRPVITLFSGRIATGDGIDSPLPFAWEGDTEQTPIDLATMFPAEYAYLKAKWAEAAE